MYVMIMVRNNFWGKCLEKVLLHIARKLKLRWFEFRIFDYIFVPIDRFFEKFVVLYFIINI